MKNIIIKYLTVAIIIPLLYSCATDDIGQVPDWNDNIGAVTNVAVNPDRNFYNFLNPLDGEFYEFELTVDGFGITDVNSVDLYIQYTDADGAIDPITNEIVPLVFDRVFLSSVNSFPITIQIPATDVAAVYEMSTGDFDLGDGFLVDFELNTADGRTLTYALQSDLCNEPLQSPAGGCSVAWSVACPSNLAGSYTAEIVSSTEPLTDFVSPLQVTVTGSAGQYVITDGTMAIFGTDTPIGLRFTEICNTITVSAESVEFPTLVIFDQGPGTSFDPNTGVITFDIIYNGSSCCGLPGIEYTFTATPN